MKDLLKNDFAALKKSLSLLAILVIAFGIYSFWQGTILLLPLIFMLIPVILLGLLFKSDSQDDDGQNMDSCLIKRRTVVLSRYVFIWIIAVIGMLVALLLKLLMKDTLSAVPWYLIAPAMLLLVTILPSIQLPLIYKIGAEKVRSVFFFIYFVLFALFFYFGGNEDLLSDFLAKLTRLNLTVLSVILMGAAILLNAASFALSVSFYEKQE